MLMLQKGFDEEFYSVSASQGLGGLGLITPLQLEEPLIHHFPRKRLIPVLLFHISADK